MFYKYENENLMMGPFVQFPTGEFLSESNLEQINLPFNDWYWFETEQEAKNFFGIKEE